MEEATLKTKDGKHAKVKPFSKGLQLVVEDLQVQYIDKYKVCVHTDTAGQGTRLAFFFPDKADRDTGTGTVPKVSGDGVKLEKIQLKGGKIEDNSLHDSFLFEWKELGGGKCLRSVAEPQKHLFVNQQNKVSVSSNDQEFALFELLYLKK